MSAIGVPICITTPDGEAVATVSVWPSVDTVYQVCVQVNAATQIPVKRQQLLFAGRELPFDARTLEDHGVVGKSTLQLVRGKWLVGQCVLCHVQDMPFEHRFVFHKL